ncbi:MAG: hypothetical protein GXO98_01280 [Nitrospirae bacterium]|nr:hypothetical protein [Nitrospirota bacterium]
MRYVGLYFVTYVPVRSFVRVGVADYTRSDYVDLAYPITPPQGDDFN